MGPLPGHVSAAMQLVPLGAGRPVIIGSNTDPQWSSSGDALWISAGAVPDGRSYIVPLRNGQALPPIPEGGFHSEEEIATLPGGTQDRCGRSAASMPSSATPRSGTYTASRFPEMFYLLGNELKLYVPSQPYRVPPKARL